MAVKIYRLTGAATGGVATTYTDITSINTRLNAEDAHSTAGTSNPILIPSAGTNYSYKCSTQLGWDGATGSGTINNIKWYTDGSNSLGTGVGLQVKSASATYVQATGTEGESGGNIAGTNAFTYTSASPLSITGSTTNPTDGTKFGNIVEIQTTVGATASVGPTAATEACTWRYDSTIS